MRFLTFIAAAILGMTSFAAAPAAAEGQIRGAGNPDAIPGSYIVVYKDAPASGLTAQLAVKYAADVTYTYDSALRGFAAKMTEAQAKRLAAHSAVAYVEQDQRVRLVGTQVNPPSWGLDRIDQRNRPLDSRYNYQTTASNVHVYIIDTGIRITHNDFGGRAVWNYNAVDNNNTDCNGHGTHVAGTAGGAAYGVAKAVRLHAIKVLNCSGSGTISSVIAGVNWVTSNKIRPAVANMSLGLNGTSSSLDSSVRNSIASGVTYSIAAGNNNRNACGYSPARVAEAITVGASTSSDARASFSNFGSCVDLFAPGQGIKSAWHTSNTASNTISGTSMAAPHVAGAAALYLSSRTGASPAQTRNHVVFNGSQNRLSSIGSGSPNVLLHSIVTPPRSGTNTLLRGQRLDANDYIRSNVGNHELIMQGDGNLVQYQGGLALWHTGTHGNPGAFAVLQSDGNFVIYRSNGTPIWNTGTHGTSADRLVMQDDGNVVLYGSGGQVFWHK